MAHFQNQYSAPEVTQTDAYGNPTCRTDEYGNPIPTQETGRGILGIGGHHHGGHHGLHRTGSSSSSSSSSEDEGTGKKKKGLKERLKEKIPGNKEHQSQATSTTTPGQGPTYHQQHHEKKGVMDKIKEKLPGHHNP
ncbi:hypothetical protein ES332_A11G205000v1 [Gossypium tomentosum]|uniref:Dehydrin n=1 Tax=Gossypium tomentosum TaxID=34277 RepID=A0A5D2NBT6_GOSTO|nr:hypothetical protein ES332_A11G205000v1 [Gossypium tomentosum]